MLKNTITVTVQLEGSFWTALFERNDAGNYTVARKIFGKEPTDPELYEFLLKNYHELKYTEPQKFKLIIKRKNPKRVRREVRKAMEKGSKNLNFIEKSVPAPVVDWASLAADANLSPAAYLVQLCVSMLMGALTVYIFKILLDYVWCRVWFYANPRLYAIVMKVF